MEGFLKLSTAVNITVLMIDSSDHITGKTGLAAGLTIYATKAAGTPAAITPTVAELDATNVKGLYSLALTTTHTNTLGEFQLHITATGADPADYKWQVSTYLPGEAALLQTGSGTGQLDFTSGVVKANATQWLGGTIPAVNVTGIPKVDIVDWLGTAPNSLAQGKVDALNSLRANTAQTNAADTTSIKLDAGASAVDSFYVDNLVMITGGTGAGQVPRLIYSYTGATKVASVKPDWTTAPDNTSTFIVFGCAMADTWMFKGGLANTTVTGVPGVDVQYWSDFVVPSPNVNGVPIVDTKYVTGTLQTARNLGAQADVATSTRAAAGDAMALTAGERNSTADAFLARSLGTEGYAAKGAVPTLQQAMFMLLQNMQEMAISSTTLTIKKIDGSTTAMTYTLDSATTPTSRTRAT